MKLPLMGAGGLAAQTTGSLGVGAFRKKGEGYNLCSIETILDDEHKDMTEQKKTGSLAAGVERMTSVFADATKARDEQRQLMDDLYEGQMRQVATMRSDMERIASELAGLLNTFVGKFEGHLDDTKDVLAEELRSSMQRNNADLEALEVRAKAIQEGIDHEREERLRDTDEILAPIRKEVAKLTEALEKEQRVRVTRDAELNDSMRHAVTEMEHGVQTEQANREQRHADTMEDCDREHTRLERRQQQIESRGIKSVSELCKDTDQERAHRKNAQDHIVQTITQFIQQFQADIKEEGEMG